MKAVGMILDSNTILHAANSFLTLATSLFISPFQIHLSKYLSSLFNDSCLMCELHTTNLIISNDSVNLPCVVIRLGLCRTVGLTRTYYLTLMCVRWPDGLYKCNYKTLITFSIKVTVCKIKGDWFFLEIFIYLPPFFDNSKISAGYDISNFREWLKISWKSRKSDPTKLSVTPHSNSSPRWNSLEIPVECTACLLKTSPYFTPKYVIFLDPISDLNCCSH